MPADVYALHHRRKNPVVDNFLSLVRVEAAALAPGPACVVLAIAQGWHVGPLRLQPRGAQGGRVRGDADEIGYLGP